MKTTEQIIDEIILKNPWGHRLWRERQLFRQKRERSSSLNDNREVKMIKEHPKQTYFNFK